MTSSIEWTRSLAFGLCVVGASFSSGALAQQATTDAVSTPILASGTKVTVPTTSAGQKACIDPKTGALVSPEEHPECKALIEDALRKEREKDSIEESVEGLKEEPLQGGGKKIDLKGRFKMHGTTPPQSLAPSARGRIAVVNPDTGQLVTGDAAARLRNRADLRMTVEMFDASLRVMMATAQDVSGFEEQRLETGAIKLDLQGRFRIPLTAIIGPDGGIALGHGVPTPE